ncbi:MAG: hypothetical protein Harvfovirus39_5 [Harvfovirus sp.]|uniref:Uncharacterized protein n=1 Tax=Harvfovirus sp. TaxID=2487768 RepID=A0A3G5A2S5_9VIRU|nr:MAG: hypothetical protein Harvfovirus39_5 [Harvfovirus sp.]
MEKYPIGNIATGLEQFVQKYNSLVEQMKEISVVYNEAEKKYKGVAEINKLVRGYLNLVGGSYAVMQNAGAPYDPIRLLSALVPVIVSYVTKYKEMKDSKKVLEDSLKRTNEKTNELVIETRKLEKDLAGKLAFPEYEKYLGEKAAIVKRYDMHHLVPNVPLETAGLPVVTAVPVVPVVTAVPVAPEPGRKEFDEAAAAAAVAAASAAGAEVRAREVKEAEDRAKQAKDAKEAADRAAAAAAAAAAKEQPPAEENPDIKRLKDILSDSTIRVDRSVGSCVPTKPVFQINERPVSLDVFNAQGINFTKAIYRASKVNCGKATGSVALGLQCCYDYWFNITYKNKPYILTYEAKRSHYGNDGLGIIFADIIEGSLSDSAERKIISEAATDLLGIEKAGSFNLSDQKIIIAPVATEGPKYLQEFFAKNAERIKVGTSVFRVCQPQNIDKITIPSMNDTTLKNAIPFLNQYGIKLKKYTYKSGITGCGDSCCHNFLFTVEYKGTDYHALYLANAYNQSGILFNRILDDDQLNRYDLKSINLDMAEEVPVTVSQQVGGYYLLDPYRPEHRSNYYEKYLKYKRKYDKLKKKCDNQ